VALHQGLEPQLLAPEASVLPLDERRLMYLGPDTYPLKSDPTSPWPQLLGLYPAEDILSGGGGGIRTHETFVCWFSRPVPSTTRPPLHIVNTR
jgi:hypothetical protein